MTFIGTVPKEARIVLAEILDKSKTKNNGIWVGCSGNFTIDKMCYNRGYKVHSNDVSLYSKTIADTVMGLCDQLVVKEDVYAEIFNKWESSRYKNLIMVMFVMTITEYARRKNSYQIYMYDNLVYSNKEYYKNTLDKIERSGSMAFSLEEFYYGDFRNHLQNSEGLSMVFAPTYTNGYEKLYAVVDEVFDYERPNYDIFNSDLAGEVYKEILDRGEAAIYSDTLFVEIEDRLCGVVQMPNKKKDLFIYSSVVGVKNIFLMSKGKTTKGRYRIMDSDYVPTKKSKIVIRSVKVEEINHYKNLYMGLKVDYSDGGDFGLVMAIDGSVFGFASFSKFLGTKDKTHIFLQSDFVVNSKVNKLSKLVLYLLTSETVRRILMDNYRYSYSGMQTSVVSSNPVSMKYRGVFDKIGRSGDNLSYVGRFKHKKIKELYNIWLQKYHK